MDGRLLWIMNKELPRTLRHRAGIGQGAAIHGHVRIENRNQYAACGEFSRYELHIDRLYLILST